MGATAGDLLASAEAALAAGDIAGATDAVAASLAARDTGDGRFLAGALHMMDERYAEASREWQAAFARYREEGSPRQAARAAIEVARLFGSDAGLLAMGRGWVERARTVLDGEGPCAEWGHLELVAMACDRPDVDELLACADRALAIAVEHGDAALEARALADGGLALVSQGRTREGFARLEAALATIGAGGVDWDAAGICYCSMLTACDRAGEAEAMFHATSMGPAVPKTIERLAALEPTTLAVMHGSSFHGDGATQLRALASGYAASLAELATA